MFAQTSKLSSDCSHSILDPDDLLIPNTFERDDYERNPFFEEDTFVYDTFQKTQDFKDKLIDFEDSTQSYTKAPIDKGSQSDLFLHVLQDSQQRYESLNFQCQRKLQTYEIVGSSQNSFDCRPENKTQKQESPILNQSESTVGMETSRSEDSSNHQNEPNTLNQSLPSRQKKKKHKNANFPAFLKKILFTYLKLPKNEYVYSYMRENDSKFATIQKKQGSFYNNKYLLKHEKLRKVFEEMIRTQFYERESQLGRAELINRRNYDKAFESVIEVCQYKQTSTIQKQYLNGNQQDSIQNAPIF